MHICTIRIKVLEINILNFHVLKHFNFVLPQLASLKKTNRCIQNYYF